MLLKEEPNNCIGEKDAFRERYHKKNFNSISYSHFVLILMKSLPLVFSM